MGPKKKLGLKTCNKARTTLVCNFAPGTEIGNHHEGCGKLWVTDGIWKLQFAHCMFRKKNVVKGVPLLNYPDVCTEGTKQGMAFCEDHCKFVEQYQIPTKLRAFLQYAKIEIGVSIISEDDFTPINLNAEELVEKVLAPLQNDGKNGNSVIETQSGQDFLRQQPVADVLHDCESDKDGCYKDLGEKQKLRKMSRGHQFMIRAGGHIDMWTPLYQSESLGQVFIFLLSWLYLLFKRAPDTEFKQLWLAYDNMCNLLSMKAARHRLALPKPFDKMFKRLNKVIDGLHIRNHRQHSCKVDLHPDNIYTMYTELQESCNTMAAEQTFVWLVRYKKILCAMSKTHHMFYLHHLVYRRNVYTAASYAQGRKPLLPKLRNRYSK